MNYYKIIKNNSVIGIGTTWLKWNMANSRYFYCDMAEAEAVENIITGVYYFADWLRDPPQGAEQLEEVTVVVINQPEYEELYEQLDEGEDIPVLDPPEPETPSQSEPSEQGQDQQMTIAEMRIRILELEDALSAILGDNWRPSRATQDE